MVSELELLINHIDKIFKNGVKGSAPAIRTKKIIFEAVKDDIINFGEFEYLISYLYDVKMKEDK